MVLTIGETRISFVEDYIENSVNPEYVDMAMAMAMAMAMISFADQHKH